MGFADHHEFSSVGWLWWCALAGGDWKVGCGVVAGGKSDEGETRLG